MTKSSVQTGRKCLNARFFARMLLCVAYFTQAGVDRLELLGIREYIHYSDTRTDGTICHVAGRRENGEL
ncbi:hypothetical protein [Paenibacillus maysiensis]|uniref:hypothetical protein n=1 Tax=Paenibacillus maysiensis TaxID=1155954 RepID=UPI0012DD6A9F|nr:hypothetical protein [Paenibacillus maysiensis]